MYEASYNGNDKRFLKSYRRSKIFGVERYEDFWGCVMGYKESFEVTVHVIGQKRRCQDICSHLSSLITTSIEQKIGRKHDSSFFDDMDPHERFLRF